MKFFQFIKIVLVIFLVANFSLLSIAQDFRTVGYFPTYRFHLVDNINLHSLTHLNIAFANPDPNGNLTTDGVDIEPIVKKAHDAGLEVFIALAGGAAKLSDWVDWIKESERSNFIHGIINYTLSHELEGIDIDLEWGNVNEDYSGFVIELKDSVDKYNLQLSVALPGTYRYPEISQEALEVYDWINLMAYDLTGPWASNNPGPHSPYTFAESAIEYWVAQGVNKDDMTLGVPFYGYDFTNQSNVKSVTFADMVSLNKDYASIDQVGEIYYNGLNTIEQKTRLALDELSGVMIWEIGQDNLGEYALLQRISETIEGSITTNVEYLSAENTLLYPNPVQKILNLNFNENRSGKIRLVTQLQVVLQEQVFFNQKHIRLDLGDLPPGMIFLTVESESSSKTYKLFKA